MITIIWQLAIWQRFYASFQAKPIKEKTFPFHLFKQNQLEVYISTLEHFWPKSNESRCSTFLNDLAHMYSLYFIVVSFWDIQTSCGQKYDKIVILVFEIARCEVYRIFHNHDETEKFKKWSI